MESKPNESNERTRTTERLTGLESWNIAARVLAPHAPPHIAYRISIILVTHSGQVRHLSNKTKRERQSERERSHHHSPGSCILALVFASHSNSGLAYCCLALVLPSRPAGRRYTPFFEIRRELLSWGEPKREHCKRLSPAKKGWGWWSPVHLKKIRPAIFIYFLLQE